MIEMDLGGIEPNITAVIAKSIERIHMANLIN